MKQFLVVLALCLASVAQEKVACIFLNQQLALTPPYNTFQCLDNGNLDWALTYGVSGGVPSFIVYHAPSQETWTMPLLNPPKKYGRACSPSQHGKTCFTLMYHSLIRSQTQTFAVFDFVTTD